jgi:transcription elongation factor
MNQKNNILSIHKKHLLENQLTIGKKIKIQQGEFKGHIAKIRDVEGDEVQVSINNKIKFLPLKYFT